jgi:hypothetical protein
MVAAALSMGQQITLGADVPPTPTRVPTETPTTFPQQVVNPLFSDAPVAQAAGVTPNTLSGEVRERVVVVDFGQVGAAGSSVPQQIELNLFSDVMLTADLFRTDARSANQPGYVWLGSIMENGEITGDVVLVVGDGTLAGTVTMPGVIYNISPTTAQVHVITEIDPAETGTSLSDQPLDTSQAQVNNAIILQRTPIPDLPPNAPPPPPSITQQGAVSGQAEDGSVVNVMMLYTTNAKTRAGSEAIITSQIEAAIQVMNLAMISARSIPTS